MALFEAAARFCDRLPGAGSEVFLDHLTGQEIPADSLAARAPTGDAVAVLTAHASKGLEWDLVCVAGVQEGVWPSSRLRGSFLGTERLVDLLRPGAESLAGRGRRGDDADPAARRGASAVLRRGDAGSAPLLVTRGGQ